MEPKKILITICLILSYNLVTAQVWCTTGSKWTYYYKTFANIGGHLKYTYSRDTLINGKTINIIKAEKKEVFPSNTNIATIQDVYTYVDNSVVYINRGTINNQIYDTLYNFNASIGDKWRCISSPSYNNGVSCSNSFLEVLDTGRIIIQGQSLKWLKFYYKNIHNTGNWNQNTTTGVDTIYERFGTKNYLNYMSGLYCGDFGGVFNTPLLCFSDNQINQLGVVPNYSCPEDITVIGIEEFYKNDKRLKIINPVSKKIEGSFYHTNFKIEIINSTGMVVFSQYNSDSNDFSINADNYKNGLYYVRIIKENEVLSRKIIVHN